MPPKRNNKKKKVKTRDRNQKAINCYGCSRPLNRNDFLYCSCTKVRYCSSSCQQEHEHVDCPGPPETRMDLDVERRRLQQHPDFYQSAQYQELLDTVTRPSNTYLRERGYLSSIDSLSTLKPERYAELAEEGTDLAHQALAYLAASGYKHRVLGSPTLRHNNNNNNRVGTGLHGTNRAEDNLPIIEAEELAFHYFKKAAKLGHGLSMQSLSECYEKGIGCKKNDRYCDRWLWRACLLQSAGAIQALERRKMLLSLEVVAQIEHLERIKPYLGYGQTAALFGPNLSSLLVAFLPVIEREKYSLPPFAGIFPTATIGTSQATPAIMQGGRVPLIAAAQIKYLRKQIIKMESKGHGIAFRYGRRGTAKAATAQTTGADPRCLDCQMFTVPPAPACDETVSLHDISSWVDKMNQDATMHSTESLWTVCIHNEQDQNNQHVTCKECIEDAVHRLWAVSTGGVALSVNENLPNRGQAVIFRGKDDTNRMETWKTYSGGEADCMLAILAATGKDIYTEPLFVAQDPNLFWPLIFDHGCIRAALEYVAPHLNWNNKLGRTRESLEQRPLVENTLPGANLLKCGNDHCAALIPHKSDIFMDCAACTRRRYCSIDCQHVDWKLHQSECEAAMVGSVPKPQSAVPSTIDNGPGPAAEKRARERGTNAPRKGEEVVIHGLKSQPQYNQALGVVGEKVNEERFAVALSGKEKTLSVKADNLYTIDVFCRKRKKKSNVFECYEHALEVCGDCYLDFTLCNSLARLYKAGTDITILTNIDQVIDSHYASIKHNESEREETTAIDKGWPTECHGMGSHPEARFILAALVQTKAEVTVHSKVARAAIIGFGARKYPFLREKVHTHLVSVAQALTGKKATGEQEAGTIPAS